MQHQGQKKKILGEGVNEGRREEGLKDAMGLIFVISAPSGTGKTTLLKRVMERLPNLRFSISYTTRPPRANEEEGKDYYFVSPAQFEEMVQSGAFLEWAEVVGNRYGTAKAPLERLAQEGYDILLDLDVQGARKVKEKVERSVLIFILPPSYGALRERLVTRGLDSPEVIRSRLANAMGELKEASRYDYVIVNESLEEAVETLRSIIVAERCRSKKEALLRNYCGKWEEDYGKNYGRRLPETGGEPL